MGVFGDCDFRKRVTPQVVFLSLPSSFFQCAFTLLARAEMSGHTGGTETRSLHRVLGNILEFDILSLGITLHPNMEHYS